METIEDLVLECPTINEEATVEGFLRLVSGRKTGFFGVIDREDRLVGVVREKDLLKLVKESPLAAMEPVMNGHLGGGLLKEPVTSIMRQAVAGRLSCTPREALDVMVAQDFKYLLITDADGKVAGYVRLADIIRKLLKI
ncbi:MAG: CBS domain-containing protein [Candidatus Aenigmarchaeota archaeon]|nr:CBS domain-containing protein [Candidatus Aenigmarchaeota archaeon]